MRCFRLAALLPLLAVTACGATAASAAPAGAAPSTAVAPAQPPQPRLPAFSHVMVLVLENHSLDDMAGRADAPAFNAAVAQGAVASNYFGVSHPSEPNYLALLGGDTFGVTDDDPHRITAPTLVDELEAANHSWKGYFEGLAPAGPLADTRAGYAQKHDPFVSFNGILTSPSRMQNVQSFTQLQADLASGTLPDFSFVAPNMCHDMHDCSPAQSDAFLGQLLSQIQTSPSWDSHSTLFIVFDEDNDQDSGSSCCGLPMGGGQTGAVVLSPLVAPGSVTQTPYNHYSLLRTIEDSWSLPPLGHTADPGIQPMADVFATSG